MEIRDPIHGPIPVTPAEAAIIDSPWLQRLRNIKQLGFSELTFPGAGHSRFLHSLGAMHLAGLAFDAALREADWLAGSERARLRQTLRLAALCHDLGHPPLSHSSEVLLPPGAELGVPDLRLPLPSDQGSHEHFTLLFLLGSGLRDVIDTAMAPLGVRSLHVAALISDEVACDPEVFRVAGRNFRDLLAALVSGELDVDRMDYLLRDSYFTGVSYGEFDVAWLIAHLCHRQDERGHLHLGLEDRALFSFDDFLLSRHHMFLMVYFHKKSVCYDQMLRRFYADAGAAVRAPASADAYLEFDDHALWRTLRQFEGRSPWAAGILHHRPLRLVAESSPAGIAEPIAPLVERLQAAGIDHLFVTSKGALSKYHAADRGRAIYVRKKPPFGPVKWLELDRATRLFERYADHTLLTRLYVHPTDVDQVGAWLVQLRAEAATEAPLPFAAEPLGDA